jgi:hypothetical protein
MPIPAFAAQHLLGSHRARARTLRRVSLRKKGKTEHDTTEMSTAAILAPSVARLARVPPSSRHEPA